MKNKKMLDTEIRIERGPGPGPGPEIQEDGNPDQANKKTDKQKGLAHGAEGLAIRSLGSSVRTVEKNELSQSDDGDENQMEVSNISNTLPKPTTDKAFKKPQLGNLHKRRASASPDKFNTGSFQPLTIHQTDATNEKQHVKRRRIEDNVEVTYDSDGTPTFKRIITPPTGKALDADITLLNPNNLDAEVKNYQLKLDRTSTFPPYTILQSPQPIQTPDSSTEKSKRSFKLLDAIIKRGDLAVQLVSYLTFPSLMSLYSISKPFHYVFNRNQTSFILSSMRTWAPGADTIYPWGVYKSLCIRDPEQRPNPTWEAPNTTDPSRGPNMQQREDLRTVPSLRWLQMVIYRQGVCKDMIIQLATKGLLCPPGTLDAVKKMWFILDLPLNMHRVALMRAENYITEHVIECAMFFLLKVDMLFTDPVPPLYPHNHPDQRRFPNRMAGALVSGVSLRKTLLAERHLTPLWRVLRGWTWDPSLPAIAMTRLDVLRLWVRHSYQHPANLANHAKKMSVMGVPWYEVGVAGYERTGVAFYDLGGKQASRLDPTVVGGAKMTPHRREQFKKQCEVYYPHKKRFHYAHEKPRERLMTPDQLMLGESVKRKMEMHKNWVEMMLYGFCDELGNEIPVRTEKEYLELEKQLKFEKQDMEDWKIVIAEAESGEIDKDGIVKSGHTREESAVLEKEKKQQMVEEDWEVEDYSDDDESSED